ncbi:radical SAM protein [bacterium]|nr:radical SAM protein [bacterium]
MKVLQQKNGVTQQKLGSAGRFLTWLDAREVEKANQVRNSYLRDLTTTMNLSNAGTKPHHGILSPGCQHCGDGTWSCLFINQTCNADCFYCPMEPAPRENPPPTALGVDFPSASGYVDFLVRAGYGGVGLSGGEPLLNLDRTMEFIKTIRDRIGDGFYLWLYTNGILANRERLGQLFNSGVNEIRFDISAINYSLKPVRLAREWPWRVTIEIPTIPEGEGRVAQLMPVLDQIGVDHLHLHQLTVNRWNAGRFVEHDYTLLHEPDNAVLDSELAALRLLKRAADEHLTLNVQYCAREFKSRFQGRGRRLRLLQLGWGDESPGTVNDQGYIVEETPVESASLSPEQHSGLSLVKSPPAGCLVGKQNHLLPETAVRRLEPVLVRKLGLKDEQSIPLNGWEQLAIRLIPVSTLVPRFDSEGLSPLR